jgi:hypothetical protein
VFQDSTELRFYAVFKFGKFQDHSCKDISQPLHGFLFGWELEERNNGTTNSTEEMVEPSSGMLL